MATRIVVISDHPLTVFSLCCLLGSVPGCRVVDDAGSWSAFRERAGEDEPELVILDLPACIRQGAEAVEMIGAVRGQTSAAVMVLTDSAHADGLANLLDAGASAIVQRRAPLAVYLDAMTSVIAGRRYVHDGWAERTFDQDAPRQPPLSALSRCERQVLALIAKGNSVSEIAGCQAKTVSTVSRQKRTGMRKLGAANDRELFDLLRAHPTDR